MSRIATILTVIFALSFTAFAQSDRGTITGTVQDQGKAVVPGARVVARNMDTGAQSETVTTGTGNYTLASIPAGRYEVSVEVQGFKKFTQQGIEVQVAQTARIDAVLQIGSTSESVTVNADAPLLRTENAEQSQNINGDRINALPLNFGGINNGSVRNPLGFATLAPGTYSQQGVNNGIRVNGAPVLTFKIMYDGQDATNGITPQVANVSQASVEAIQEFTLQASNFSAEFGQVSGGIFNFTARSGSNQFHGSAYEYFTNEALNAGQALTDDGNGRHINPRFRKNDFGASVGGPVLLPKLYDGHDKTFFFFNIEAYRNTNVTQRLNTVPTDAMRNGDFSSVLTGKKLGTDPLGRAIMENTLYDPSTSRPVNGVTVRDPFPGNIITDKTLFDPVSVKVQNLIPKATRQGVLTNNWDQIVAATRNQLLPSVRADHSFSPRAKVSFSYAFISTHSNSNGGDGLPVPLTAVRPQMQSSHTYRLNYDYTLSPTMLLHAGVGEQRYHNPDSSGQDVLGYDAVANLGLVGGTTTGFPRISGLSGSQGGMALGIGPTNANDYLTDKPTAVVSVTWVKENHTFKTGFEWQRNIFTNRNSNGYGSYSFGATETGLPSIQTFPVSGGSVGYSYASFLLGRVNNASVSNPQDPQYRKWSAAVYVQDTWKITRKLTLDIGLRYDYQPIPYEMANRRSAFGTQVVNPSAGGLLGGMIYEGYGPGRCNCSFGNTYPYEIGPRLGIAYQLDPKTVLRGGWGLTYAASQSFGYTGGYPGLGWNTLNFTTTSYGDPALTFKNGLQYDRSKLYEATFDPGLKPSLGQIDNPPALIDSNAGRAPRINQWNIALQREVFQNLSVEVAYVGNRGVWYTANSLVDLNANTPARLASFGLDINIAADRTLLTSRLDSPLAISRGFKAPYATYSKSLTVSQSLRPYPQFGNLSVSWAPLGKNWYDALQAKVTKRYSYGLDLSGSFTWQKELSLGTDGGPINDVFNRQNQKIISPNSIPLILSVAANYQIPKFGPNRLVKAVVGGWVFGTVLRYASGLPIQVPGAQNSLNGLLQRGTLANRVPGEPLFLKDPNCHCFDPNKDFILNRAAWSDPLAGQWGTSAAFYNDYRSARRPDEQLSFGRVFRIRERMSFQIRGEAFNAFNRLQLANPSSGNALATQNRNSAGVPTSGFGYINSASLFSSNRTAQIVGRFQW